MCTAGMIVLGFSLSAYQSVIGRSNLLLLLFRHKVGIHDLGLEFGIFPLHTSLLTLDWDSDSVLANQFFSSSTKKYFRVETKPSEHSRDLFQFYWIIIGI